MASNFGLSLGLCMVYIAWPPPGWKFSQKSPDLVEPCVCEMYEALGSICRAVVGREGGKGGGGCNEMSTVARISPQDRSIKWRVPPWRQIKDEVSTTPLLHSESRLAGLLCPESLREDQGLDSKASLHCKLLSAVLYKISKGSATEFCATKDQECPVVNMCGLFM